MKLLSRLAAPVAGLVLAGLTATACAPQTSDTSSGKDEKTGDLRVWLFQEVNNGPKAKVVDEAVAAYEKAHQGSKVHVQYIPVDSRAEKIKAAFNDPSSAPDVIEYGNTDTAGYVRDGGLADISEEFDAWEEAADTDEAARASVTVDGRTYGAPYFVGVRALYYRTDLFEKHSVEVPRTLAEVASAARKIREAEPGLYGIAVGGAYTYGAMPFLWAHGGGLAEEKDGTYTSTLADKKSQAGIAAYTDLFGADNCPAAKCAQMGGNDTVTAFAAGKAGMAIGGDFSHQAMEDGKVKGKYAVVPLPGVEKGEIAPAFAGGNNLGVLKSTERRSLAVDLVEELAGKKAQGRLFEAMGFLPTFTDVRAKAAADEPFVKPFVRTLEAGATFVPASPAWAQIDSSLVLPTMFQEIASGRKDVATASRDAAGKMDDAFASAG
ncbi:MULTISPECIES: extracellular solute-binding protein [Streptomyces]|uniref:ABC transporter substrate-binding protein n=4 Tax=Streptomyces diastaticus group TaxID=2849069 RepID=A0A6A0CM63_9ACTN|nr:MULTISPECIES: extracellular solute-binding protein [Streptomyces]NEE40106.1 extracellular solute-binding protein [Streptomyces sp. SID7982]NEE43020.1 extracellular solute-binding protein [Streptomyces sp. SID8455]MDQ0293537.1 N,N'-diacetylchitobiose transport system substrate-binding protein [Streptomyces sp. DSM 41037]PJM80869.1 ABC transporter substrate-binding protein [Streptomyces sp. TSRI0384-2]QNE82944.1 extracellular solute-binding protein [Streptomyces rutgersensis]